MIQMLALYGMIAAGLCATLAMFWSVKREIHASAARSRKRVEELARAMEQAPQKEPDPVYIHAPARPGLNISRRVQAMRMFRRNEDVSHIAATLGVTRREVELLIRVHRMKPGV